MRRKIVSNPAQRRVISQIFSEFEKGTLRQVLNWYTGSGKTHIILSVCRKILDKHPEARIGIWAYLQLNIKDQWEKRAPEYLTEEQLKRVKIFNPQSVYRKNGTEKLDYLMIDESHEGISPTAKMIVKVLKNHCKKNTKILAATATGWELLEEGLFKDAKVYKRGLDKGYFDDKRVANLTINMERFDIDIQSSDYQRGELTSKAQKAHQKAIKHLCATKLKTLQEKEGDKLGSKILILVPPGNNCMFAKHVYSLLGNEQAVLVVGKSGEKELQRFFHDPTKRFLVAVKKCKVGFDFPELDTVIDLTMTQNIKEIVQRLGRVSRICGTKKKRYYYVFDKNTGIEKVESLLNLACRGACCIFDGPYATHKTLDVPVIRKSNNQVLVDFKNLLPLAKNPRLRTVERLPLFQSSLKKDWLPLEEVKRLLPPTINSQPKYREWARSKEGVPVNPQLVYEDQGWPGWMDFLGKGAKPSWSFEKAREHARSLGLKSQKEYKDWIKENPGVLPYNPDTVFKECWKGMADYLGKNDRKVVFPSFEKAREHARSLGLKSQKEYSKWVKENPGILPSNPHRTYRACWGGYQDYLGTLTPCLPLKEAKKIVRSLNFKSLKEYLEWVKSENPEGIPVYPFLAYKNQGWRGWPDYLGYEKWSFAKARKVARAKSFGNMKEYQKWARSDDCPLGMPIEPRTVYKNQGWRGWPDYLGYERNSNRVCQPNQNLISTVWLLNLNTPEKILLVYVSNNLRNVHDSCTISNEKFQSVTHLSRRTIQRAVASLIKKNFLSTKLRWDGKSRLPNEYRLGSKLNKGAK